MQWRGVLLAVALLFTNSAPWQLHSLHPLAVDATTIDVHSTSALRDPPAGATHTVSPNTSQQPHSQADLQDGSDDVERPTQHPVAATAGVPWSALGTQSTTTAITKLLSIRSSDSIVDRLIDHVKWFSHDQDFTQQHIDTFAQHILHLYINPKFILSAHSTESLVKQHHVIHWLLALQSASVKQPSSNSEDVHASRLLTPTSAWKHIKSHSSLFAHVQRVYRRLLLVSAVTQSQLSAAEHQAIFQSHSNLWNFWYTAYFRSFTADLASARGHRNLLSHLTATGLIRDQYHVFDEHLSSVYYAGTYIGSSNEDIALKYHLNNVLQHTVFEHSQIHQQLRAHHSVAKQADNGGQHHRLKLAVICGFWTTPHSVYRITAEYLHALSLSGRFELTLLNIGQLQDDAAIAHFDDVQSYPDESDLQKAHDIIRQCMRANYDIIWFPSIGMSFTDIYLSNTRLAPMMMATHGHAVSTYGSQVDYWMSGSIVEAVDAVPIDGGPHALHVSRAQYSESLVLLPGYGAVHNRPLYNPTKNDASITARKGATSDNITISLPLTGQKINYPYLQTLNKLLLFADQQLDEQSSSGGVSRHLHITFQVLPHIANKLHRSTLHRHMKRALHTHWEHGRQVTFQHITVQLAVRGALSYNTYMQSLAASDVALEGYHYGGGNTIIDTLWVRCPIVTWRGTTQWYNRIGSAIVEQLGIQRLSAALVSNDELQYVHNVARLLTDQQHRLAVSHILANADLSSLFTVASDNARNSTERTVGEPTWFVRAALALQAQHFRLQQEKQQYHNKRLPHPVLDAELLWREQQQSTTTTNKKQRRPKRQRRTSHSQPTVESEL